MAHSKPHGRLEVICGPMFAGKTTELLRRVGEVAGRGQRVASIKPARDDRYHATRIVSHDGSGIDAMAVATPEEITSAATSAAGMAEVVAIDEVHFFGAALVPVVQRLVESGVRVIVVGLERDHRGQPFEPFPVLLCGADEVVKLTSRCTACGGPAVHSQRMVASSDRIVVGGAEAYQPRCRACFVAGK